MKKITLTLLAITVLSCESPFQDKSYEFENPLDFEVLEEGITDLSEVQDPVYILNVSPGIDYDTLFIWHYDFQKIRRVVSVTEKLNHVEVKTELQPNEYPMPIYGNPVTYQVVLTQKTGKHYVLAE